MSKSPERRFATSPKHEMLKKVFTKPRLSVVTASTGAPKKGSPTGSPTGSPKKVSLLEYKRRQTAFKNTLRVLDIEEQLNEMSSEVNKTRERVDSISLKLDLLIQHICKNTQFEMDDI